jgi:hypothetical protein
MNFIKSNVTLSQEICKRESRISSYAQQRDIDYLMPIALTNSFLNDLLSSELPLSAFCQKDAYIPWTLCLVCYALMPYQS